MSLLGYADVGMAIAVQGVRGVVASDCVPPDALWQMKCEPHKKINRQRPGFVNFGGIGRPADASGGGG